MTEQNRHYDHVVCKFDESGKGSVSINGHELKSSVSVSFKAQGGGITLVDICLAASIEADALAEVNYVDEPIEVWDHAL